MFLLLSFVCAVDVPQFQVTNKCPPAYTVVNKIAAPAVAAKPVFRGEQYNASHSCPTCGRQQLRIDGYTGGGQHRHVCPVDGTSWVH